jgi:hypothetical protein
MPAVTHVDQGHAASSPLRLPRGHRYEVLAWSRNRIPETSSVVDHRHAATSDLSDLRNTP